MAISVGMGDYLGGMMSEKTAALEHLRDELRTLANSRGAKAIVIVMDGDTSAYAYTNMGPGAAVDLISSTRAAILEGMK